MLVVLRHEGVELVLVLNGLLDHVIEVVEDVVVDAIRVGDHLGDVGLLGLDALLVVPEVHVLGLKPLEPRRLPDALLRVQLLLAGEREVRVVCADLGGVSPACLQIVAHRRVLEEDLQREVQLKALVTEAACAADMVSAHRLGVVRQLAHRHLKLSLKALVVGCGRACTIYLYDFLQSVLLCRFSSHSIEFRKT